MYASPFFPRKNQEYATVHDFPAANKVGSWQGNALPLAQARDTPNTRFAREDLEKEMHKARNQEFLSTVNQQIQARKAMSDHYNLLKQKEMEQRLQDLERHRAKEVRDKRYRKDRMNDYCKTLDVQSGNAERQAYQSNLERFYGAEEAKQPKMDFDQAAKVFFGAEAEKPAVAHEIMDSSFTSLTPFRLAKTVPKTLMSDPITGAVRSVPSRGRILSLGNYKPETIAGKINYSPPPKSVFLDQPNYGKKIPRKVIFNPLTGERKVLGEKSTPLLSSSFEKPRQPDYLPYNPFRSPYLNRVR
jgi:hypothetical protein